MVRDLRADPPPADWASAGFDGVELRPLRGRPATREVVQTPLR